MGVLVIRWLKRLIAMAFPAERVITREKRYLPMFCIECGNGTMYLEQGTIVCDTCGATKEAPYHE